MTPCNRFFGQRVRPCAAADEGRMANTLSGPAACCRFTSSWWRPVCLDRAQRGTVAACHNRTRSVFDRTLRNRAHVSRSRACGPAPVYEPCPDRRARERRFGHRPQGRRHIPPLRRVQGGQRSSSSITGISRCRPLGYTTRRWRLRQPRQKVVPRWHQGSLVQVGHRCASLSFDGCATPFFLEVIPLAPLVSARTPPIALTGVLSGLALRDLFAIPGNVFGGPDSLDRNPTPRPAQRGAACPDRC